MSTRLAGACLLSASLPISLQVSRTSMREALIALEVEGLVRINVGSGIYVLGPSSLTPAIPSGETSIEGPFEILHAREILEPSVAAEAAFLPAPEHIEYP